MAKTLTAETQEEMVATATKPRTILKIEFPLATTKYYSDQEILIGGGPAVEPRVLSWGALSHKLDEGRSASAVSETTIELRDDDQTILGYFQAEEFQRVKAHIYQWFEITGHDSGDFTPLLEGIITAPVEWVEERGVLRFDLTDIAFYYEQTIGVVAKREDFSKIAVEDEDSIFPLVYGEVKAVECVNVVHGGQTELVSRLEFDDAEFIARNAEHFPQGETILVTVDDEIIEGEFNGNTFTVDTRGYSLYDGTTTGATGDPWKLKDANLAAEAPLRKFFGKPIYIEDARGYAGQWRHVIGWEGTDTLLIDQPIKDNGGAAVEVDIGSSFSVKGKLGNHAPGTIVQEYLEDGYWWIANVRVSDEIVAVEAYGTHRQHYEWESFVPDYFHEQVEDVERWAPLPTDAYEVDLDDEQYNAVAGLEHVTTIKMRTLPSQIRGGLWSTGFKYSRDALRVWIKGAHSFEDAYVENPADVIEDVLRSEMGLGAGDVDIPGGTVTGLSDLKFGFALRRQVNALEMLADLAFQCHSMLVWECSGTGPQAKLRALRNCEQASVLTIDNTKREIGGLTIEAKALEDIVTEVTATWTRDGEPKHLTVVSAAAESAYGRHVRQVEFWAYAKRHYVHYMAAWWLERWKIMYDQIRLVAWLDALEAERGDTVTVNVPGLYSSKSMFVTGIDHAPGSGTDGEPDRIELALMADRNASGCGMGCETIGCESYCELVSTTLSDCWVCETTCQNACQLLSCVTGMETICRLNCLLGCMIEGDQTDQSGGGDEPDCAGSCTISCTAEETGCGYCEVTCQ